MKIWASRRGRFLIVAAMFGAAAAAPLDLARAQTLHSGTISDSKAGVAEHTNRLIESRDPYLRLHAHNPVDWYPWGPEALEKAKAEHKPIFVSIGYSTCFWCHVAERTIYSNPDIAKLMNQWFVNVKIDREERPDLDQVYMLATQIMKDHGGWPNNVFLTPDLKPFYAGSYFPPTDDPVRGMGFPKILEALHAMWVDHEQDKVLPAAENVFEAMQDARKQMAGGAEAPIQSAAWLAKARDALLPQVDTKHGGLGSNGGTKFPRVLNLEVLLTDYRLNRDAVALAALRGALNGMAFGGIHDQLAGGFHRYSTDPTWSVPHFEKMLYDNAQLLGLYAQTYAITKDPLDREMVLDIGRYLGRDMMANGGGFYTAQDAETDGVEGATYLWTRTQIAAILGETEAEKFLSAYALTPLPNTDISSATPPQSSAKEKAGVPRIRLPIGETTKRAGFRNATDTIAGFARDRAMLLETRGHRPQPARDQKMVISLNGLAISGLATAGTTLEEADFIDWAKRAADRLWTVAYDPATGALKHQIYDDGRGQTDGYLDDYAMFGSGLLSLYQATKDDVWRTRAAMLADQIMVRFGRADVLTTTADPASLIIPAVDVADGDVPSGASATIDLLLKLAVATGDTHYEAAAKRFTRRLSARLAQNPEGWSAAVVALNSAPSIDAQPIALGNSVAPGKQIRRDFKFPETSDHLKVVAVAKTIAKHDELEVTLNVAGGYHVNANPASGKYLIPTSIHVEGSEPETIFYPTPIRFRSSFAPEGINVYEGKVTIRATFAKGTVDRLSDAHVSIEAQACDAEVCLQPSTISVAIISSGAQGTQR